MAAVRRLLLVVPVLVLAGLCVGCVRTAPAPGAPPTTSPTSNPGASTTLPAAVTPAPAAAFIADGSAKRNKPWFDAVNTALFAANDSATGREIIDALVASGFDKASMQVTPDKTSINGEVDSILFSVKIGDSCLLGQHGGGQYSSAVEAAMTSGLCLVGKTRVINW